MTRIHSFPPVENPAARVLILGTMPGPESLRAGQYYAYRHNAFWPLMGRLIGVGLEIPYEQRLILLRKAGLALWDVFESCTREGGLDSRIRAARINDFPAFFKRHPRITHVFFNGALAEHAFRRHVPAEGLPRLRYRRLPSSSPANASYSFARKLRAWRAVPRALNCAPTPPSN